MFRNLEDVRRQALEFDRLRAHAESMLTATVRAAHRQGFSQREIAAAIDRSQPEVSRLLRFRGTSPLAMKLRKSRAEILALARDFGLKDIEVFGSVARGTDHSESDIDLLFTASKPQDLFTLAEAEVAMSKAIGVKVDLVARESLKPHVRTTALEDAIPL